MMYPEDMDRIYSEGMKRVNSRSGNYVPSLKSPFRFRNVFLILFIFILGGWYIADQKRSAFENKIEKIKQDSIKHIGASHPLPKADMS